LEHGMRNWDIVWETGINIYSVSAHKKHWLDAQRRKL